MLIPFAFLTVKITCYITVSICQLPYFHVFISWYHG